jgi:hypothetical protein
MPLLVIETEGWTKGGLLRVTANLATDTGSSPAPVSVGIEFAVSPVDREQMRWYLEDYLEFTEDPAPRIAERVERRMEELGEALFRDIFHISGAACDLWVAARPRLAETRVEVRQRDCRVDRDSMGAASGSRNWNVVGAERASLCSRPAKRAEAAECPGAGEGQFGARSARHLSPPRRRRRALPLFSKVHGLAPRPRRGPCPRRASPADVREAHRNTADSKTERHSIRYRALRWPWYIR